MQLLWLFVFLVVVSAFINVGRMLWTNERRWKRYGLALLLSVAWLPIVTLAALLRFGDEYILEPE